MEALLGFDIGFWTTQPLRRCSSSSWLASPLSGTVPLGPRAKPENSMKPAAGDDEGPPAVKA
jgi:hypothetical protein